ncbi:MAG: U32 family peptidase [Acidobacteria bacterium]|nr:U32 family peptidase [Acidobacteriota bacterium]
MNYFSVPADFKEKTIDAYHELNKSCENARVIETYGNITLENFLGSGRPVDALPLLNLEKLQHYIAYSQAKDIDFNYTLNAAHMNNTEFTEDGIRSIMDFLDKLYHIGIRSLTVSLPSLMEIITSMGYDFEIKVSVISQVTTANKARFYQGLGAKRIMVDEAMNRDFYALKRIAKAFDGNVEIIVNAICHKDCGCRMFHYNQIASDSIVTTNLASINYYAHRCLLKRFENIGNLLRLIWVRPEDLKYYNRVGINYFKLQGRQAVIKGNPVRVLESYFKESFDGNLMDLLDWFHPSNSFSIPLDNKKLAGFILPFFENENFCKSDCKNCNYCESFARKCIDYKKIEEIATQADDFYNGFDVFKQVIRKLKKHPKDKQLMMTVNSHGDEEEFDF